MPYQIPFSIHPYRHPPHFQPSWEWFLMQTGGSLYAAFNNHHPDASSPNQKAPRHTPDHLSCCWTAARRGGLCVPAASNLTEFRPCSEIPVPSHRSSTVRSVLSYPYANGPSLLARLFFFRATQHRGRSRYSLTGSSKLFTCCPLCSVPNSILFKMFLSMR